jgi:peptide/nickel transport system substrate-binding protein
MELLADAGFADGLELTLHSPTGRYMQDIQISEAVQSYLADVGVKATIKTLERSSYLADIARPKDEAIVKLAQMGWGVSTGDADQGLFNVLHGSQHTPGGSNRAFYDNAEFNALLEQGRVEIDVDARKDIYAQALQIAFDDAAWLFLHSERQLVAVRDNVRGLLILPTETIDAYGVVLD